ncbi:TlpA family protein disulfide reductase [Flavobacterium sp. 2]|uniref:TlpA family protein disulfide reductase n=1 Tax=Flavobacterium sp. 2 TaxID=308053 RepID=UPI003CF07BF8
MKKTAITVLMICFCLTLSAQHKFSISGTIPSQYKGADIILSSQNSAFASVSTKEKNGKFYLSGEIKQGYEPVVLSVQKDDKYVGTFFLLIGSQNMTIDIEKLNQKDFLNNFHASNLPFNEEQKEYKLLTRSLSESAYAAFNVYFDARSKHLKASTQDSLWTIVSDLRKKLLVQKIKFIESHPNQYISLYVFNKDIVHGIHLFDPEELSVVYDKFSNDLKQTDLGKSLNEYIQKKLSFTVGHILPNFSFSTDKGQNFELSSFSKEKKYVLLCFWSNGCAPCIKKIPTLKVLNKKYESRGLQLISISLDSNTDVWLNSLKKYEMPWLQTCDASTYIQGNRVQDLLEVDHMPQYFLIDSTGKLIYHNEQLNDDDEFSVLQKLLESKL